MTLQRKTGLRLWHIVALFCLVSWVIPLIADVANHVINGALEPSRQRQCAANLRQIGLAIGAYHTMYGCYPPSFIPDRNGKPQHSWRVLILPFLGKRDLYAKYRFDEPWDGASNAALEKQMPEVFRCPSQRGSVVHTGYAMLVGPNAISDGPTSRRITDIKKPLSNLVIVAEAALEDIRWMEPRDLDTTKMTFSIKVESASHANRDFHEQAGNDISSYHQDRANVLLADGTVRTLSVGSLDPQELEALTTIEEGKEQGRKRGHH